MLLLKGCIILGLVEARGWFQNFSKALLILLKNEKVPRGSSLTKADRRFYFSVSPFIFKLAGGAPYSLHFSLLGRRPKLVTL